ncbi:MAG: hypothetical protein HUK40_20305 [Desulfobacter sp.]|nr:hypothetical protein [Desulfobacter sp.]
MEKKIDFNQVIDRSGTGSMKWEPWVLNSRFGNKKEGLLPLWVADMDFLSPKVVCDALESRLGHQIYGYTVQGSVAKNY